MTRKIFFLIFPLFLLVFVSTANAQTATNAASKLKQQTQLTQEQKNAGVLKEIREEARVAIQAKKEEFKAKLQVIKDQKKRALAERINTKILEANKKQTEKFTDALNRLQGFLDKISKSAANQTVASDIAATQTAIDIVKTAVEAQAEKTYTMTITDDSALKLNVGVSVSQLRQDLMAIYKLVIDVKQAVQKLNTDKKEATSSAKL